MTGLPLWWLALVSCLFPLFGEPATATDVIRVPQGADFQQALERARPGSTILLSPGVVYVGNFVLPSKPGTLPITVRTSETAGQPRPGLRVHPSHASTLAKIQSPNSLPSLATASGARHWRFVLIEFPATQNSAGDIITLGSGSRTQTDRSQVPQDLTIDRCYIHGDPDRGQKRGIALNSGATTITNSYISDIKTRGQDSQAIAGWNGPGPYVIENNYLEGAGENFLLGGADPAIQGLITEDVTFRRNHLTKPLAWREQGWQVKNLFELKNARRVLVEGNLMEYSWQQAQVGYAILLTPRNQDGGAPWATVEDVTIRYNVVRHAGGGLQIIGADTNYPSETTRKILITDNLFYDIDSSTWGGSGAFALIGNGPNDITIEHNTIRQTGNIVIAFGGSKEDPQEINGFRFRHNLIRHNLYGVHGSDRAPGADSLQTFFPGAIFATNGIGGGEARSYPGNQFVSEEQFDREFLDVRGGDFRLRPGSPFRGAASGGRDLGANLKAIAMALGLRSVAPTP